MISITLHTYVPVDQTNNMRTTPSSTYTVRATHVYVSKLGVQFTFFRDDLAEYTAGTHETKHEESYHVAT